MVRHTVSRASTLYRWSFAKSQKVMTNGLRFSGCSIHVCIGENNDLASLDSFPEEWIEI
jgi:hypothetical protein